MEVIWTERTYSFNASFFDFNKLKKQMDNQDISKDHHILLKVSYNTDTRVATIIDKIRE